jgi:arylsulfatase A-like enzyme
MISIFIHFKGRRWLFVLVPLTFTLVLLSCSNFGREKTPRNLVLIAVDTLRQDHLGCYGYERGDSKTIDGLAWNGVMFTQARSAVPLTLPSFASIFTSTYPLYHKIRQNEKFAIVDSVKTLTEVFRDAGFRTMAVIGSAALASRYGLGQGFDMYDDDFIDSPSFPAVGSFPTSESESEARRLAPEVVERAINWLDENSGDPFFLFLHFFDPHLPYDTPEKLPMDGYRYEELPVWAYDSEIANVDRQVERLMAVLEAHDLIDNTLVVLTADHGEGLMEHMEATHGYFLYDSTIRIPLIFSCPGVIPRGKVVEGTIRTIDLMPTLIDLFHLEMPDGIQGISFKGQLLGDESPEPVDSYFETYYGRAFLGWSELKGVQWNEWKYIQAPKPELYNLTEDPGERVNLVDERPEVTSMMKDKLDTIESTYSGASVNMARSVPMDPEHKELLESLGYLTDVVTIEEETDSLLPDPKDMMEGYYQRQIVLGKIRLAGQLIQGKEYDAGVRLLEGLGETGSHEWLVHYQLGLAYMGKSDVERAGEEFRKALEITPIGPERVKIREALRYYETKQRKGDTR